MEYEYESVFGVASAGRRPARTPRKMRGRHDTSALRESDVVVTRNAAIMCSTKEVVKMGTRSILMLSYVPGDDTSELLLGAEWRVPPSESGTFSSALRYSALDVKMGIKILKA